MISIKVTTKGFEDTLNFLSVTLPSQIEAAMIFAAESAKQQMQATIKAKTRREGATGRLRNSLGIKVIKSRREIEVGVGYIPDLMTIAPYWYLVNYGGLVNPKARRVPGVFDLDTPPMSEFKGSGVGSGQFTYVRNGPVRFLMNVTSPILPMYYIEAGFQAAVRSLQAKAAEQLLN